MTARKHTDPYHEAKQHGCAGCAKWVDGGTDVYGKHRERGECHAGPAPQTTTRTYWCALWEAK